MTTVSKFLSLLVFVFAVSAGVAEETSNRLELTFQEGSKLWLEGDSTFHGYKCEAEVLRVDSEVVIDQDATPVSPTTVLREPDERTKLTRLLVTIPIKNMTSGIIGLSPTMRRALKYKQHPNIVFEMTGYHVQHDPEQPGTYRISAQGEISLAGRTRPANLEMSATIDQSRIVIQGEHGVLMTDFGVDPPTAMFGAIKAADEVVIKWDLKVGLTPQERRERSTDSASDKEQP